MVEFMFAVLVFKNWKLAERSLIDGPWVDGYGFCHNCFFITAKDSFRIPSQHLGNQGGSRLVPKWVDGFFPKPFVAKDLCKAWVIVHHLVSKF
jgi:hypothetical protein